MKIYKTLLLIVSLMLICSGCIKSGPTEAQINSWNFGPFPSDYKNIVKNQPMFQKDRASTTFEFEGAPTKTWVPTESKNGYLYGYGGAVRVTNKNDLRVSKSVPHTKYEYLIRDGSLILIKEAGRETIINPM